MNKEFSKKLKKEKTEEEKKQIIEGNKFVLSDKDLEQANGGRPPKFAPIKK